MTQRIDEKSGVFIDYYSVLGLSWHANAKEIETACEKIKRDNHGADIGLLQEAYDILLDTKKRIAYNEQYLKNKIAGDDVLADGDTADLADNSGQAKTASGIKPFLTPKQEDVNTMVNSTQNYFTEFNDYLQKQLSNKEANLEFKGGAVDRAEVLYRQGMWPILSKIKELAGEESFAYTAVCELHSVAVFSLGDLCMWAERYEQAIGMYNTALALSSKNKEQADRCEKAIRFARDVIEEVKIKYLRPAQKEKIKTQSSTIVFSYMEVLKWVSVGVIFASVCLWGVILFLEFIFGV